MRYARGAVHHQGVVRLDDDVHLAFGGRGERFEADIISRARMAGGMFQVIRLRERVVLRVKKTLPHHRNDAHQRTWITATAAPTVRGESNVLKNVRLDDGAIGFHLAQRCKGAGAANDAFLRNNIARRETKLAQFFERLGIRRESLRDAALGRDLRDFVTGTGDFTLLRRQTKKLDATARTEVGA